MVLSLPWCGGYGKGSPNELPATTAMLGTTSRRRGTTPTTATPPYAAGAGSRFRPTRSGRGGSVRTAPGRRSTALSCLVLSLPMTWPLWWATCTAWWRRSYVTSPAWAGKMRRWRLRSDCCPQRQRAGHLRVAFAVWLHTLQRVRDHDERADQGPPQTCMQGPWPDGSSPSGRTVRRGPLVRPLVGLRRTSLLVERPGAVSGAPQATHRALGGRSRRQTVGPSLPPGDRPFRVVV